jgi:transcriptional regulator NrdR family protein
MIVLFFGYEISVLYDNIIIMERKSEHFFDGDKLNMSKVMSQISQHPDKMEQIMTYVIDKVKHYTEFEVKKEHLKEKYDHKMKDLYAEYMTEE